jgi:hypothetical protein
MQRALEALGMERQTQGKVQFPPFVQKIFEQGKLDGIREGELKGLREALLGLVARAGIALAEDDRARIGACDDAATLDRWVGNVLGAKTAGEILS